jgi:hypothetical protein
MAEIINSLYLWACAQSAEFEEAALIKNEGKDDVVYVLC